jgi:2-iminobutanoate/2-iminopropanoate deaminase
MSIEQVSTEKAPAAIGPYSQGYIAGDFLFTSGQGGLVPSDGSVVEGGIIEQAEQTMNNLKAILEEAGTDFSKVVKATCYLADMNDFSVFNAVYEKYFISKPARSCIAVKQLPLGILCEVEVIVYLK